MAKRPTIPDLARAAGVSVATVNRVLAGSGNVRAATMSRVLGAAKDIGFYATGSIQSRIAQARPRDRFAVLLQQPGRAFYEALARNLEAAAAGVPDRDVAMEVHFMQDLSPSTVAAMILSNGSTVDGLAVVAANHPLVSDAIERVVAGGTPVVGLIAPLTANCDTGYVGLDPYKVGRTAGWTFDHLCRRRGKIAVLVGSHRYRNHDLNESGFRSYCREYAPDFTILEPQSTFETASIGREVTERILTDHPDLAGLYASGGGITGVLAAIRDLGRSGTFVAVGHELFEATKTALIDGTLTTVLHHPLEAVARETVASLIRAKADPATGGSRRTVLDFLIYTRENI